jgi:hypothetical protein
MESAVNITEGTLSLDRSQCNIADPTVKTTTAVERTRKMSAYFNHCDIGEDGECLACPTSLNGIFAHSPFLVFCGNIHWAVKGLRPSTVTEIHMD